MTDAQEEALAVLRQNAPNPVVLHVAVGGKLVMLGKATTRSASNTVTWPRPSQDGQAPTGLLKLKRRGSSSLSE